MSFYTELQVRYTDFDTIDLSTEKQNILEILTEDSIHEDVYNALVDAFSNGQAGLNVDPVYCLELIEKITALFPNANFECRGLGEEYFYTWILCVENGQIIFSSKPWETENPFI
ncbi:hypothetical protein ACTZ9G_002024 [Acinetobacter baumannii]|jgi:hypothetical protein|uniref:Uncharacterized protein n=2 Tax=Acinetobacter baumannii TaxID=470 RepID=A0A836LXC7_ACIBA|nr:MULTISPECIES: hypothetical protein [Acinetobacter]ADX90551.1 hypothetical protein ABTW07_0112 [Acinetobacter baumannii TCDC-AB0715]AGQ08678.1 hypothetical protein BJAB0868_00126 [Acinetobacter baumannii BJAB0868]AHB93087.1 hypothetical protein P795_16810 [Acinetobacter baumannii ZW85-1]AVI34543.1 hypothetical protein CSB70_3815 [Acinetobacter baumannii]AVI35613.1 hypothetical protein CSB68_3439 [Acinetobacter baumannii]